jgi:pimeloyl-ACP methyl ester carboxylesterase
MSTTVTSADGTAIVCDVVGEGPSVVLVAGIFCTRHTLAPLAAVLADRGLKVATYDRRGRGDSGGTGPAPSPERAIAAEIEDLAAVMAGLGDDVAVYGHSSGACVAFHTVAAGMPVRRLVLHEPPWSDDDADAARAQNELIRTAVAEDRLGDAITLFMADTGMPADALQAMATDPAMVAVAPTMPYDIAVTGSDGAVPEAGLAAISVPTLVVAGTASPTFFVDTARRVAALVPDARLTMLEGADHGAPAEVVGPAVSDFLVG